MEQIAGTLSADAGVLAESPIRAAPEAGQKEKPWVQAHAEAQARATKMMRAQAKTRARAEAEARSKTVMEAKTQVKAMVRAKTEEARVRAGTHVLREAEEINCDA